jgi:ribosomal protein L19E
MKLRAEASALAFVLICLASSSGAQQKTDSNDTSLGDLARQLKAQKTKDPKPALVITNDNISTSDNAVTDAATPPKEKDKSSVSPAPEDKDKPAEAHDERYFRSKMSTLQSRLDTDKRELDILQQKLGQNQVQFYSNPQDSLMQQYSRSDIDKLTADLNAKKQQVADDEKAIDDLRDELRHDGGDPGWLRSVPEQAAAKPATPDSSKQLESSEAGSRTREFWQDKFKAGRADLAKAKQQLQLSEDEFDLLQIQQVRELDTQAKADLTAKLQAKQSEVDVNKAAAEAAQKALDALEKELKDSGAPEDWSQTD